MEIINIKENKDGSADITFEFTREEEIALLQFAVAKILGQVVKNAIEISKEEKE